MKIGYVCVSKQEQREALQIDALEEAGCDGLLIRSLGQKQSGKDSTKR
jgi:DNA invertase Pin-like site-specific DNA recombinase